MFLIIQISRLEKSLTKLKVPDQMIISIKGAGRSDISKTIKFSFRLKNASNLIVSGRVLESFSKCTHISGACFSKVQITFRPRKAVSCLSSLHSRSGFQ